jgi:hypothetical protein
LLEAVDEALEVARRAEVACSSRTTRPPEEELGQGASLARRDRARPAARSAAYADVYPYVAMWTDLDTILPDDVSGGGRDAVLERLADPEIAAALALRSSSNGRTSGTTSRSPTVGASATPNSPAGGSMRSPAVAPLAGRAPRSGFSSKNASTCRRSSSR